MSVSDFLLLCQFLSFSHLHLVQLISCKKRFFYRKNVENFVKNYNFVDVLVVFVSNLENFDKK